MADQANSSLNCPRCGARIHRVHRRYLDRLISLIAPHYRYRCFHCGWSGLRPGGKRRFTFKVRLAGRHASLAAEYWLLIIGALLVIAIVVSRLIR